jgi:DNA-binding response OmpR family regulator
LVTTAPTGRLAIASVLEAPPDVVLLDLGLPDMDGKEVARELLRGLGDACPPLIAVTGWGQAEDRRSTADAGFRCHLTKPVDPDALRQVIDALD